MADGFFLTTLARGSRISLPAMETRLGQLAPLLGQPLIGIPILVACGVGAVEAWAAVVHRTTTRPDSALYVLFYAFAIVLITAPIALRSRFCVDRIVFGLFTIQFALAIVHVLRPEIPSVPLSLAHAMLSSIAAAVTLIGLIWFQLRRREH